ncbi:MAG: GGDEF domain-containing protein [Ruminiclostridium sp.]|nr:GGDEF domain-containing protein [Ruminiclostridium sp.]
MEKKKKRFSIGSKMYLFVTCIVLAAVFGTAALSYFISAGQIDTYFKRLAYNSATNFASFMDTDFLEELKTVAASDEFQAMRDRAEEEDNESELEEYLTEKGLWDRYCEERDLLCTYLYNMEDIKYLYVIVLGPADAESDMFLLDDYDNPIYETGYYEERESELRGMDPTRDIEPTINNGDWGWLCSAYAPVRNQSGKIVCHVGCDVDMEDIMKERVNFLVYTLIGAFVFTVLVLLGAILFANRVVVRPLNLLTAETRKFRPAENITYEQAGVIDIDLKSRDEISDIYNVIRSMEKNIVDYLNDLSGMHQEKLNMMLNLRKAEDDIKEREEKIGEISKEAYRDPLTGTGNKASYNKKAEQLNEQISSGAAEFGILMADLNNLKKINDEFGHKAGDNYIIGCSHIICEIYKHSPVFRIGGDEFVVILQGSDYKNRYALYEQITSEFAKTFADMSVDPPDRYSASVGMAEYAADDSMVELVFKRADKAMYVNKVKFKTENGSYR